MDDEREFPVRMFVYHYRIFDKYNRREVVSFAVLGDDNPNWRPQSYTYQRWGTEVGSQLMPEIRQIFDHEQLMKILRAAATVASPDELRKLWANGADSQGPR